MKLMFAFILSLAVFTDPGTIAKINAIKAEAKKAKKQASDDLDHTGS